MVKRKFSGQTVAIIILSILLVVAIVFGGAYAFYSARTSKTTSGRIVMGNVTIDLVSGLGISGKSEIVISNSTNLIPGQSMTNTPLTVLNKSSVPIYLIVVYKLEAYELTFQNGEPVKDGDGNYVLGDLVQDNFKDQVIDVGAEYINTVKSGGECADVSVELAEGWVDYVFEGEDENNDGSREYYRCLVLTKPIPKPDNNSNGDQTENGKTTVIKENKFKLSNGMGNNYQSTHIVFTFQAFAIGSETEAFDGFDVTTKDGRANICATVVGAIYQSQGSTFLTIDSKG